MENRTIPSESPISKLSHDILLRIFQINANMGKDRKESSGLTSAKDRAINVTRNSSQVSFLWRDLIVTSPVLWANLIDVDALSNASEPWRAEVFRRTRSASLHIKGTVIILSPATLARAPWLHKPWWLPFLEENWERVRIFDLNSVHVNNDPAHTLQEIHQALPFLWQSAPALESFCLNFHSAGNPTDAHWRLPLFANQAPRLRNFDTANWPSLTRQQNATWLPNLQHLSLLQCDGRMFETVDDFYQLLRKITRLEYLHLHDPIVNARTASSAQLVPIQFPLLARIEIRTTRRSGPDTIFWDVLDFIVPRLGCSIEFIASYPAPLPAAGELVQPASVFSRYAENYLKVHKPTHLVVRSSPALFMMSFPVPLPFNLNARSGFRLGDKNWNKGQPFFTFFLSCHARRPDTKLHELLKGAISLSLPTISKLDLEFSNAHPSTFTSSQFQSFLSSFSRVEDLDTSLPMLHCLLSSPVVDISTVFPSLKSLTLRFGGSIRGSYNSDDYLEMTVPREGVLEEFLSLRKEAGVPVSILKLDSECDELDLQFLDRYHGLVVYLGGMEYICGTEGAGASGLKRRETQWEQEDRRTRRRIA